MNWVKENQANLNPSISDPFMAAESIEPSDSAELENYTRGLWIGVGGDITLLLVASDQEVQLSNIPDGTMLPMIIRQIKATGTTCEQIVGMW